MRADIGHHHPFPPEAIDDDDTDYVDAGRVKIGVERRKLKDLLGRLEANYAGTPFEDVFGEWRANRTPSQPGAPTPTAMAGRGISIHVIDADSGHEYLRFDCFDGVPHYHYLRPWATPEMCDNHEVDWDEVANGPMLPWALDRLRTRLPEMLTEAGGADLAARLDQAEIDRAVEHVEDLANRALAAPV